MFHAYLYGTDGGPIPTTFEAAAERLALQGRMFVEPDGSFGRRDEAKGEFIEGTIYDADGQIRYVDVRGNCPAAAWRDFLSAIEPDLLTRGTLVLLPEQRRIDMAEFIASATCRDSVDWL